MNKSLQIILLSFCFTTNLYAQNKTVVIPLKSNNAAGLNGQVQYNDKGKNSGADIYYEKSTGRVGIGINLTLPSSKLEVRGEIRSTDNSGATRLWGQGRTQVYLTSGWSDMPNGSGEYTVSMILTNWYGVASACPSNTWVCDLNVLNNGTLTSIPPYIRYDCAGNEMLETNIAWVNDYDSIANQGINRHEDTTDTTIMCVMQKVWCCREKIIY